jgi:hypothetical protein
MGASANAEALPGSVLRKMFIRAAPIKAAGVLFGVRPCAA